MIGTDAAASASTPASVAYATPSSTRSTCAETFLPTSLAAPPTATDIPSTFPTAEPASCRPTSRSFSSTVCPSARGGSTGASFSTVPSSSTAKCSMRNAAPPDHEQAAPRGGLEFPQAGGAGPDQQLRHVRVQLHLERPRAWLRGDQRTQPPLRVDDGGRLGDDHALAGTRRAFAGQDLARAVRDVLARHLHEAERGDLDDVGLGPVSFELQLERLLDRLPVLRVGHVDEVDDDDPADVAQPQLPDDFLHGFEVVLRDGVLEPCAGRLRARADEPSGVHVDDRERLGVVEDQIAAGRQVDAPGERRADLGLDAVGLEQRHLVAVARGPARPCAARSSSGSPGCA